MDEHIGKHSYILKIQATKYLHHVFHVNNLRPCSTASLRPNVPVTILKGNDEEFSVSRIKSLLGRRGKYLLVMTHFSDADIPRVCHRLNDVHRTAALQEFLKTPQWHKFAKTHAYIDFMHAHPAHIPESQLVLQ
jgi:hypothetical protein